MRLIKRFAWKYKNIIYELYYDPQRGKIILTRHGRGSPQAIAIYGGFRFLDGLADYLLRNGDVAEKKLAYMLLISNKLNDLKFKPYIVLRVDGEHVIEVERSYQLYHLYINGIPSITARSMHELIEILKKDPYLCEYAKRIEARMRSW